MQQLTFEFSGLRVRADQPFNIDELFDHLIAKSDDHPDVMDDRMPYWAEIWPSAIALAGFISENPQFVEGKSVLEIGCGPGLPGIVAALMGANVELTDYMQEALDLAAHNWKLNLKTPPVTNLFDWRDPGSKKAEVIIASDVAYESRSFDPLIITLKSVLLPGGKILLSEPNRRFSGNFFQSLKKSGFKISETQRPVVKDGIAYKVSIHVIER